MNREQVILLISRINENNQIYNRIASYSTNTEIVQITKDILGSDFDFDAYQCFRFDKEKAFAAMSDSDNTYDFDYPF